MSEVRAPEIVPAFRDLIPPLTDDERSSLEADIVTHGCREPLVLWNGKLIDGHNRLEICTRRGVPYSTVDYSTSVLLLDEGSVLRWICDNQLARRNLTPFQASYLRGKRYLLVVAGTRPSGQNGRTVDTGRYSRLSEQGGDTRDLVAAEHGVGARTISRDTQYARALDAIAESAGIGVRNALLSGEVRITRNMIGDVAAQRPSSIEQLRGMALSMRSTKPTQRAAALDALPFFQKSIREFKYEGEGKERRIVGALLSCGHTAPCRARDGATSSRKTMRCPFCCKGSRPRYEVARKRINLTNAVRAALSSPRGLNAIIDIVDAAIGHLAYEPAWSEQQTLNAQTDHALEVSGIAAALGRD